MTELFEAIHSQRAIRRFTDEPVTDDEVHKVLDAATRAPSASNTQPWSFVVVRDPERRRQLAELYAKSWDIAKHFYGEPEKAEDDWERRMLVAVNKLAATLETAPVLILACLDRARLGPLVTTDLVTLLDPPSAYGAIWASVQNLLLAARGLGLGTVPTTLHRLHEPQVRAMFELPDTVEPMVLVVMGRPAAPFGPTSRDPVEQVTYRERWGDPL